MVVNGLRRIALHVHRTWNTFTRSVRLFVGDQFLAVVLIVGLFPAASLAQSLQGFTEPAQTIDVAASETGVVQSLAVKLGDRVERGDLLATLDNDRVFAALQVARLRAAATATRAAAEADLAMRQRRHANLQALLQRGHANSQELEQSSTDLRVAEAKLQSAREQIGLNRLEMKRMETELARRSIRSPISGTVIELYRQPGESVAAGDLRIARVAQLDELLVRFYLPTRVARRFRRGQPLTIELPETGQSAGGHVTFVSPVTDADSGTVRIHVAIKNEAGEFQSGLACRIAGEDDGQTR